MDYSLIQTIIVFLIVAAAISYVVFMMIKKSKGGCGCDKKNCDGLCHNCPCGPKNKHTSVCRQK